MPRRKVCVRCGDTVTGSDVRLGDYVRAFDIEKERVIDGWACGGCLHGKKVDDLD